MDNNAIAATKYGLTLGELCDALNTAISPSNMRGTVDRDTVVHVVVNDGIRVKVKKVVQHSPPKGKRHIVLMVS